MRKHLKLRARPSNHASACALVESLEHRTLLSVALAYGSVASGSITNPTATSDYTFQAKAGGVFTVGLTGTPTQVGFNAFADLYGPSNTRITGFYATSQIIQHPTQTGTYTLRIHDSDFKQTGTYNVSLQGISPVNPGAKPLVSGGIVGSFIDGVLNAKEFTFTGKTGDMVSLSSTSTPSEAGFSALSDLYAPSGTKVTGFYAGGLHIITLAETGTFMVLVHDSDFAQKGTFTIGLEGIRPISPGAMPLNTGGFVSGSITVPIDFNAYTFTGSANNIMLFSLTSTPTQAGFTAFADVYAPSGTRATGFNATAPQSFTLKETGTYLVLVHDSNFQESGNYTIGLEGVSPPSPNALALPAGQNVAGAINAVNDVNQYTFYAKANDKLRFALSATAVDAGYNSLGTLYSPAGNRLETFFATTSHSFTAPATGVYLLNITDNLYRRRGSYNLSLNWTSPLSASIFGNAYNDANGNGTRDTGEAGIAGRTFFLDTNNNGVADSAERSTTTDILGNYAFDALPAGTYVVREVLAGGQKFTNPLTGMLSVTLGAGANVTGKNFGTAPAAAGASIGGRVFNDGNGNGSRDSGELGLGLWTVYIDKNNNGVLDTGETKITTDINGNWSFANLIAGTYVVRVVQPAGTATTTPTGGKFSVTLAAGQVVSNQLFGEKATS